MKDSQRKAMFAKQIKFKRSQVVAIDNAIGKWEERKKDNINDKYHPHNSEVAIKEFTQYNRQIKKLKLERDTIKGQIVLLK